MNKLTGLIGWLLVGGAAAWATGTNEVPFRVGEKLTYQIFWGPFIGGRASLAVQGIEPVDGHDCYHLVAEAGTTGLADMLFHVKSVAESWLDVQELCTRRTRDDRTEGKRRYKSETIFDYEHQQATLTELPRNKKTITRLDHPVVDVISSLYYARTRPLALARKQVVLINAEGANYSVSFTPDRRKTIWLRPLGDIAALRIEPNPTLAIVAANKGRMYFWVSDDYRKLPLLVVTDLRLGTAKLVLLKIESTNHAPDQSSRLAQTADPTQTVQR